MVNREHRRHVDVAREWNSGNIVEVQHVNRRLRSGATEKDRHATTAVRMVATAMTSAAIPSGEANGQPSGAFRMTTDVG